MLGFIERMKNIAKLTLFFSLAFSLLLLTAIMLAFLSAWIDFARFIPIEARPAVNIMELLWNVLPPVVYLSILLVLSYTARRKMPIPLSIINILVLGCIFYMGLSFGISRAGAVEVNFSPVASLRAEPGLILSRSNNAMILLRESGDLWGPRVVSIPGQPLIYQELPQGPGNTILTLPPLPFADTTPWFIRSLSIDFSLNAAELRSRLDNNVLSFAVYVVSLILFLASMRLPLGMSKWPLANLLLGALIFRGIAALEAFLNTREMNTMIDSFLPGSLPPEFITPAVFGAMALLVIFYTLLIRIVRPRRNVDAF